jgi:hypothetical protein
MEDQLSSKQGAGGRQATRSQLCGRDQDLKERTQTNGWWSSAEIHYLHSAYF